jgi:hypothetical protein
MAEATIELGSPRANVRPFYFPLFLRIACFFARGLSQAPGRTSPPIIL